MASMSTPLYKVPTKPRVPRASKASKGTRVYQLRIDLSWVKPRVWRRLLVPTTVKLSLLHLVLLDAMGWQGGHLHEFIFLDANYGQPEPTWELPEGVDDETNVSLHKALAGSASFTYVYDYGDNWQHKIKVEREGDMGTPLTSAMFIAGKGACPPGDVGGAPGYQDFLEAIADSKHPRHQEIAEWHPEPFDPNAFDPAQAQARLDRINL